MRVEDTTIKLEEKLNKMLEKREETFRIEIIEPESRASRFAKIRFIFLNEEIQNKLDKIAKIQSEILAIVKEKYELEDQYQNRTLPNIIFDHFYIIKNNINEFILDVGYRSIYKCIDFSIKSYPIFINTLIKIKKVILNFIEINDEDDTDKLDLKVQLFEKVLNSYKRDFKLFKLIITSKRDISKFREFLGKHNKWISYRYVEQKICDDEDIKILGTFKTKKAEYIGLKTLLYENKRIISQSRISKINQKVSEGIVINTFPITINDNFESYILENQYQNNRFINILNYEIKKYLESENISNNELIFLNNYQEYTKSNFTEKEKLYKKARISFRKLFKEKDKQSMKLLEKIK